MGDDKKYVYFVNQVRLENLFLTIIRSQAFLFLAVDHLEEWRMNLKQNTRKLNTSFDAGVSRDVEQNAYVSRAMRDGWQVW